MRQELNADREQRTKLENDVVTMRLFMATAHKSSHASDTEAGGFSRASAAAAVIPNFEALTSCQKHQVRKMICSIYFCLRLILCCLGWKVTSFESLNKCRVFLIGACRCRMCKLCAIDLSQIVGQHLDYRENFDHIAVARAAEEMSKYWQLIFFITMVGAIYYLVEFNLFSLQEEVAKAERAIHLMGASI
ncbi:hypothetical protein SASPL_155042 [Salvia splendens]|uniref:Uncharacterized protein n=1 Tax=Salvia splendens TaxID=180675 RepID=A0A8X8W139_SALSN|nr:hypothetical protein SASPL_155042 [Salvia splendens]